MGSTAQGTRRAYRSAIRQERARHTRRRILYAAREAFIARGYAGTTIRAVASAAGVSVPTVELLFGTKASVLKAAIDVAIAGDDEPVPVLDRAWTEAALRASTVDQVLTAVIPVLGTTQVRSAGLVLAALEASVVDADLADLGEQLVAQREITAGWIVDRIASLARLRPDLTRQDAVETVWLAMDPAVFVRLTRHRRWSVQRYQDWVARSLRHLLLPDGIDAPLRAESARTESSRRPDMSTDSARHPGQHPPHGRIGYLQLPAQDVARSWAFYQALFGWQGEPESGSFAAPGMIGQWTSDVSPAAAAGPVLWINVEQLGTALSGVVEHGGAVRGRPWLDGGERWLAEVDDPAGNRIGLATPARTAQSQTMIAVEDVERSSRWYQDILALVSDHGGPEYERLLADHTLVLQLHRKDVAHHHGPVIADPGGAVGNGVLLWFGEVSGFDDVVARAERLGVTVVRPPHRNPPEGKGNGPAHREIWLQDPDGYLVVVASPDGEAWQAAP